MKLAGRMQSSKWIVFLSLFLSACAPWKYQRVSRLPAVVREASGLHIAGDRCWWINDSGGQPTLYATDLGGQFQDSMAVPGARNVDWEALATDDAGHFFLCDFGNNGNARTDLTIYKWKPGMRAAQSIHFTYPDQKAFPPPLAGWNFSAEACFWFADSLYIFSKNQPGAGNYFTKLYAIPDQPGTHTAVLKDSLALYDRVVTAAAIRPDGKELVLLAYDYRQDKLWPLKSSLLWINNFPTHAFLRGELARQEIPPSRLGRQFEAIDYQSEEVLLLASEASPVSPPFMARLKRR